MNLDDLLALAADRGLSELERARARRATRRVQQEYQRAVSAGLDVSSDVDVRDPLAGDLDEAARISRAAQLAKLGTLRWNRETGELRWSDEMSLIFGYPPGTVRPSLELLTRLVHPDDAAEVRRTVESAWRAESVRETTFRVIRPDNAIRFVHCLVEVVVDRNERPCGIVATGQDVTEAELARQERARLSRRRETLQTGLTGREPVNGLLDRPSFVDEIDAARRDGSGVLLVVAVESAAPDPARPGADGPGDGELTSRLGGIATTGHVGAGVEDHDLLVAAVGAVVRRAVRHGDVCGVTAPGEFGVLLHRTTLGAARAIAETVVAGIRRQPFVLGRTRLRLDAWAGLVRYPGRGDRPGFDLLLDAETAWRRARAADLDCVVLDEPVRTGEAPADGRSRIRERRSSNLVTLDTQPILDLRVNQITRQEILPRLVDGCGGQHRDPGMPEGDELVDRRVVDHVVELVARGARTSHYQVNLSARFLADADLLEHLQHRLREYDVDPAQLTFEITETALAGDPTEAVNFAYGLRNLGCHLALDDFGSGPAPLSLLTYLPLDLVKIDGGLIVGLPSSRPHQLLVRSYVEICRELGIRTAAGHVRDAATLDLLRTYGVDFAQGSLIGRPEPVTGPHRPASAPLPRSPRPGTAACPSAALG
jgi:PAS domain S-box-containing protein